MHLPVIPLQQGDLDGLCGVYAVINAVRVLCPEVDMSVARALFQELIEALYDEPVDAVEVLLRGMEEDTLSALLKVTRRFLKRELDIRIGARPFKFRSERPKLDDLWSSLRREIDDGAVAIIGLTGKHGHWTVGYRMTKAAIRLVDSDDLCVLLRSRCTVNQRKAVHRLTPREIVIVSRQDLFDW
ncbi:MAG: hypothetical protein V7704_02285 [Aurantimonas endophytica]|uniref:hypothetical protein n=1 Tax=Aurantimonas endophytica TaxID=1522175 RepID=UPI0030038FDF